MPTLSAKLDSVELIALHRNAYDGLRADTAPSSAAATALLESPIPLVRIGWGVVHLFLFPVPAWAYLVNQPDSAYFLFKSAAIPYMWLLLPGVVACILGRQRCRSTEPFVLAFILLAAFILLGAVCMTSIELRHAMPAIVLLTIASCAGGNTEAHAERRLRVLRFLVLSTVVCLHLAWLLTRSRQSLLV
jgi:peptidoglycan/LPS O-acetylase OafA/YrhL